MPHRIIFDGLNLSLAQGTGVATYTRMLTRVARDLGHEVGVVYSSARAPSKNPVLREIHFFDEARHTRKSVPEKIAENLGYLSDQIRCHGGVRPRPVTLSGVVITRQFAANLPEEGQVFVARNLFNNGRMYFARTKAFLNLAFDERPDIFHCTYPLPLRVKSACNVYTIHDLVPLRLPFTTLDNKRQMFNLLKKIAAEADHIVTVSENSKRDIVELLGVEESRVTNTYQSVEFPEDCVERHDNAIADQLGRSFGLGLREYLLFYGALEPKKNILRLIEAYQSAGVDVPLVIVVSGGWQNRAETRVLTRLRDNSHIRRLDYVSFATLGVLIRGARAVVFPSLYEGFGLPVLEAMVLGTPVVASRESSVPEVAGDAALLVDPYDTDKIARAITTIVNDADLCAELSRRGPLQAAKFSRERYRDRVAAMYGALR
jgi:glycosyltransferase involved in cell wall biosynthesis